MPRTAAASTVWRQRGTALTRRTPRSLLIMPKEAEQPARLEGLAILVWDELARPATDERLVDRIAAGAGIEPRALRNDIVATRRALGHIGAITEAR